MMRRTALLIVLLAAAANPADTGLQKTPAKHPQYSGSAQVKLEDIPPRAPAVRITVRTIPELTKKAMWSWDFPEDDDGVSLVSEKPNEIIVDVPAYPEKTYRFKWTAKEPDSEQIVVRERVKAGHGPQPPPVPPGPTPPGPTPPGPIPPPTPTPGMIDAPGFHVLVKYDRDAFTRPASETSILNSESVTSVRQYLKNACTVVPDGQGWRMYPVPAGGVIAPWKAPYERNQGDLPTMVVSKNGKGWEGSIKGWTPEQVIAKCKEIEALP